MAEKDGQLVGDNAQDISGSTSVSTMAMVDASTNNESTPKLFKLNVDCFEYVFEWLSLSDLLKFRRTCKRMKAVVDYYIKLNYPRILSSRMISFKFDRLQLDCFQWIKCLQLNNRLLDTTANSIKHVLNQLESLELTDVKMQGDAYETFLKFCPNLKHLCVATRKYPIIGTGNDWLLHQYPKLEYFHIKVYRPHELEQPLRCPELLQFFQQNPNVRTFGACDSFLLMNRDVLLGSHIKLDRLDINVGEDLETICRFTNDLREQEFYSRLHIQVWANSIRNDQQWEHIWQFRDIERLALRSLTGDVNVPVMESIKELRFETIWLPWSNIGQLI